MSGSVADSVIETQFAQIADEFADRIKRGEQPTLAEYRARFPAMGDALQRVLEAVEVMCGLSHNPAGSPAHADFTGELGDYRIIREIGRGGMGVVYEAEQISLGRRVALKVLPFASMLDARQLQRFKNEARAAASLDHPNIVAVYGTGSDRGVHYYAM